MSDELFFHLITGGGADGDGAFDQYNQWVLMDDYDSHQDDNQQVDSQQVDSQQVDNRTGGSQQDGRHRDDNQLDEFVDDSMLAPETDGLPEYTGDENSSDDESDYAGIRVGGAASDSEDESPPVRTNKQEANFVELLEREVTRLAKLISSS